MTLTATAPQTGAAPLPGPTPTDVLLLQAVRDEPCLSVLVAAEAAPRMPREAQARLAALVEQARSRLAAEPLLAGGDELLDRLRALADDAAGRRTRGAVALFVSRHVASAWSLPVPVGDRVVVDPTFATRDLVRALHRTPRHVALVLTEREARLFDGEGDALVPPVASAFPVLNERMGAQRPVGRGDRTRDEGDDVDGFLRVVDRALGAYLRLHPAPLVLVGTDRMVARFTALSRNLQRCAGSVRGGSVRAPLAQLAARIRPVLESYLHSRQQEALDLLEQRTGSRRIVSGMEAVWLASRADRPEMLAVEQGFAYPARLSPDGDFLTPASDVAHPEVLDDAVDEVIETVLRRGGWVALVDDGALAAHEGIALTIRR